MTKKRIIGSIVALAIIGLLIGAMFFMMKFDTLPEELEPDTDLNIEYARQSLVLHSCVIGDLKAIHVKNPTGEYTVSKDEEGNINFLGREGAPLLPYSSEGLYSSVAKVTCDALIEAETEHLEYYGLDDPQAIIKIEMKDGTITELHLGDAAPQGGGYYIRNASNTDVFLSQTYFSERFMKNHVQYYEKTISKEFTYPGFQSLSIEYSDAAAREDIYIRTTTDEEAASIAFTGGMVMEEPFFWGGDSTPIQGIVEILSTLEADDIITDTLDPELQAKYGFADPTKVVIEAWVDTQNYISEITNLENPYFGATEDGSDLLIRSEYLLGNIDGRTLYVMYDGEPVIYGVDMDQFAFTNYSIDTFCQRTINLRYLNELEGLTVEMNGDVYDFSITDPDAGEEMVVMWDGKTQLKQDIFRSFYVTIIGVTHDGLAEAEPDAAAETSLKITYRAIDGNDTVIEYIPIDARKYVYKLNGEGRFFVYVTKVNKIKNDLNKLLNGEEIMY
ncbi:MAG: DUF4340 domain-containing protein [Clostridia bacterium]|nr:DUF4340 domain-containing protein [Clostridia bacterium]